MFTWRNQYFPNIYSKEVVLRELCKKDTGKCIEFSAMFLKRETFKLLYMSILTNTVIILNKSYTNNTKYFVQSSKPFFKTV